MNLIFELILIIDKWYLIFNFSSRYWYRYLFLYFIYIFNFQFWFCRLFYSNFYSNPFYPSAFAGLIMKQAIRTWQTCCTSPLRHWWSIFALIGSRIDNGIRAGIHCVAQVVGIKEHRENKIHRRPPSRSQSANDQPASQEGTHWGGGG